MTERIQKFGFEESPYERVEQDWHCGRTDTAPCLYGPDRRGNCGRRFACMPVLDATGNAFRCARPKASGGPCQDGPLSGGRCPVDLPRCVPVHSVRARRGTLVRMSFALTLGVLLLLLFGPARDDFVSPGELSDPHHRMNLECTACHGAAEESAAGWLNWATDVDTASDMAGRCRTCHVFADHDMPHNPHGLPARRLRRVRETQLGKPGAAAGWAIESLPCGSCHHEHRGRERHLTPTSDIDCQGCHVRMFESFDEGHPEFRDGWPFGQRNAIAFDHKAHYGGLFAKGASDAGASLSAWSEPRCTACHLPRGGERDMRPRFEENCEACHGGELNYRAGSVDSIALRFLQLPWFDEGARPEAWPEELGAMDPSEISISPEMKILLGSDRAAYERLMARMPEDERSPEGFLEMGEEAREDVTALLGALKRALEELGQEDRAKALAAVARRFKESLGVDLTPAEQDVLWPPSLQHRAGHALFDWFGVGADDEPGDEPHACEAAYCVDSESFSVDMVREYEPGTPNRFHGDVTLQAWVPFILRALERDGRLEAADLVREIPSGIKRCLKCHNIDRGPSGRLYVDWTGSERSRKVRLDRFLHAPHVGQDLAALRTESGPVLAWADLPATRRDPLLVNCVTCHVPTDDDAHDDFFLHFFTGGPEGLLPGRTDPQGARANFAPIGRALCATCHTAGKVRNDCLTCHVYHPGVRETRKLPALPSLDVRPGSR